jgi:dTDP-3,4-didehydro-2,6-dideoxy-alpha-D-glucose 3-reductase
MKILFIGYSKLFKNRLIPVLNQLSEIDEIHIAKFEDQEWDNELKQLNCSKVILYDSYQKGYIADVDIAYISSVNSDHYNSAKTTILGGIHTIIDKPAVLNFSELISLYYSCKPNKLLAEANVYLYHPQFQKIKDILKDYDSEIKTINVLFSIPPLELNNFRYKKELGGGAINDMGIYAVSIGRYFYDEQPNDVIFLPGERTDYIELSFDVIFRYPSKRSVIGHFGFNTEYVNSMTILANNLKIDIDRVYTVPDNIQPEIKVKFRDKKYIELADKGNAFYLFFKDIFNAIENQEYIQFKNIMLKDYKTLELLRHKI